MRVPSTNSPHVPGYAELTMVNCPPRRFFTEKRLGQITAFDLERYKRQRVEAKAPVSANRELAVLKALINRCQDWGRFEGDNPVRRVKFLRESRGRVRYLELEEEARLLATDQARRKLMPPGARPAGAAARRR